MNFCGLLNSRISIELGFDHAQIAYSNHLSIELITIDCCYTRSIHMGASPSCPALHCLEVYQILISSEFPDIFPQIFLIPDMR